MKITIGDIRDVLQWCEERMERGEMIQYPDYRVEYMVVHQTHSNIESICSMVNNILNSLDDVSFYIKADPKYPNQIVPVEIEGWIT